MSSANQALLFNAIPLLSLGAVLALAAARGVGGRPRPGREVALGLACGAFGSVLLGVAALADGEPLGGSLWLSLPAILPALAAALVLVSREAPVAPARDVPPAPPPRTDRAAAEPGFATALAQAETTDEIARLLAAEARARVGVEFAGLALVDGTAAYGVLGLDGEGEVPIFAQARFDLQSEPSAIASAAYEAAPFVVYDMETSPIVHRELTRQMRAKSGMFVPLVAQEQVIGVLAAIATEEMRAFTSDELARVGELAAEAALALDRTRAASAPGPALERDRIVSSISQRVRSELDPDAVLRDTLADLGPAAACSRCLVRLSGSDVVLAEWRAPGASTGAEEVAVLETPIVVFDAEVGTLVLERAEPSTWTSEETALAGAVAQELGIVIHTARLVRENSRRMAQDAALLEAAQSVTSELEPHAVLQRLVDEVAGLIGGDAADCYLLDSERGLLRCAAVHGLPETLIGYEFPADRGLSGEALGRGRPVIAADYEHVAEPVPNTAYGDFLHAIVAPVVWSGRPLGVLGVGSRSQATGFDEADADVLEAFASLASLALRNAQAFEDRSRQARVQRGFYRIASVLGEPLSLAGTLDAVAQAASEALGGSFAAVLMRRGGRLELAGGQGLPEPLTEVFADGLPQSESALHAAAAEGRILASRSVLEDARFEPEWKELAERAGYRSLLAIPLHGVQSQQPGGLVLLFFGEERGFTDDDLELARQLGGAARGAFERASRFEEERRARSLAQQLARTGTLLATELDPAAVLEEVVQQAPALLDVDASAIRVLEGEELVVTAAEGPGTEDVLGHRSPATGWLSGDVVQSRAPLTIEDAAGDDRLRNADALLGLGYRSYLGVPLAGPDAGTQGVLAVYAKRPRAWGDDEIEALLALAGNASAALANAELYQRVALAKEQADAILSNIADGIVAVDREGKVVLWNSAAEEITGVPAAEALGRTPQQVLGRDLESLGGARGNRLVSILRGGEEVWLSLTEAIMRDPAGIVAGRIYAFRDISADRLVEQMKSDFVSTVSQELRRPLTSIYGFAETLLRRDVAFGEDERRVFLGYITSESERLTEIVDRLLSVARLDTGDLHVDVVPTDVASVVSEAVASAEGTVDDEHHRLVLEVPDDPLHAEADPERLRQVLGHLIENAVKFSPEGGKVTVAARRRNGAVEVSVSDEGVGIPPGERERIFRKFYRGDTSGRGGTGLGLFIVQGLVEAMGGTISVDSTEGGGSSFSIELPLADAVDGVVSETQAGRV